ncbi:MAG: hypothetical protein HYT98_05020 [Candidatus Sungbacteria bacterium]|nr:hypothetical protein [Candidatus Sungbacteria bacterium]
MFYYPKKILCRLIVFSSRRGAEFDEVICEEMLRREAVDWLYYGLGIFTYCYLAILSVFFFLNLDGLYPVVFIFLDALQEPYLGALGVYVLLKEVRKRRRAYPSRYFGELFVVLWVAILFFATLAILVSDNFHFGETYRIIFINSVAAVIILIGSLINKP